MVPYVHIHARNPPSPAADLETAGYNTRGTAADGLAGTGFVSAVQRRLNTDPTYLLKG